MNSKRRFVAIALGCLAFLCLMTTSTNADIPRPDNEKKNSDARRSRGDQLVTVVIESTDSPQARLYIPSSLLAADVQASPAGTSSVGTTVSGVALSLSMVFGGLWLARSRKRLGTQSTVTAGVILLVLGGTGSYAVANMSPFPIATPGTLVKAAPSGEALSGKVRVIHTLEDDNTIRLLLPREAK